MAAVAKQVIAHPRIVQQIVGLHQIPQPENGGDIHLTGGVAIVGQSLMPSVVPVFPQPLNGGLLQSRQDRRQNFIG